jgi:hypothetical protein
MVGRILRGGGEGVGGEEALSSVGAVAFAESVRAALQEAELNDLIVMRNALILEQLERIEHLEQMDNGYRLEDEARLEKERWERER